MFKTYFGDFKSIYFSYNIFDDNRFAMSIKIFNFFPTTQARLLKLLKMVEKEIPCETAIEDFTFINQELKYASLFDKYFFENLKEGQLERNIKLIERKLKEWQGL